MARAFGVHSAMATATIRLCPNLKVIRDECSTIRQSPQIRRIFSRYTQIISRCLWMRLTDVSDVIIHGSATRVEEFGGIKQS